MPFPTDDYTPHGYLDTPTHTRNLTPRGVLRSWGAGFRRHFPAYAGMYGGRREAYRAGMRVELTTASRGQGSGVRGQELDNRQWTTDNGQQTTCPYHSKNLFVFELTRGEETARVEYQLVGEHVLHAAITGVVGGRWSVVVEYTRLLSARGEWGESGLVGRRERDNVILQAFEDGESFVLWSSVAPVGVEIAPDGEGKRQKVKGKTADKDGGRVTNDERRTTNDEGRLIPDPQSLTPEPFVTVIGKRGETVSLYATITFDLPHAANAEEGVCDTPLHPTPSPRHPVTLSPVTPSPRHPVTPSPRHLFLARGKTLDEALRHLEQARRDADGERARKLAEDAAFWARAPRLEGDWPEHWRRGMVYDLETVRMMVKQPIGIYAHIWDAMQIQAPRVVLAEAAMDALLLAYADPQLAQELMLGTFLDAPLPNVPCSREDGSYNMVAADGTVCGTAPSWGYPWLVLEQLDALLPNQQWRERIYPRLVEHLDWWLAHRRDAEGWLHYACSWESGQDDSPRFGAQPLGGGHPVRHVYPVDLHAAFAHAALITLRFALALGRPHDAAKWLALAEEFRGRTEQLWQDESQRSGVRGQGSENNRRPTTDDRRETDDGRRETEDEERGMVDGGRTMGDEGRGTTDDEPADNASVTVSPCHRVTVSSGRLADFDTHTGGFTDVDDVMLLAPVALGVATPERVAALTERVRSISADTLEWPMGAWTALEAALAAGLYDKAAELVAAVCERAYGFWDAREAHPERTLPGIACEYWPLSGRCGGEGYGWGAFTTHLLLRGLLGFAPASDVLQLRPNLPPAWRVAGKRFVCHMHFFFPITITLEPLGAERVAVTINEQHHEVAWGETVAYNWKHD
jgi:hypothetical protein